MNGLVALVSFGVSGIYLSFLMTVIGAWVARSRGWVPEGRFTLGRWGMTVTVIATTMRVETRIRRRTSGPGARR